MAAMSQGDEIQFRLILWRRIFCRIVLQIGVRPVRQPSLEFNTLQPVSRVALGCLRAYKYAVEVLGASDEPELRFSEDPPCNLPGFEALSRRRASIASWKRQRVRTQVVKFVVWWFVRCLQSLWEDRAGPVVLFFDSPRTTWFSLRRWRRRRRWTAVYWPRNRTKYNRRVIVWWVARLIFADALGEYVPGP